MTTGYVAVCGQHGRAAAAPLATSTGTPRHPGDSWGCAARGLSPQDADGIERHMLQLLQLPGRAHAARSTPTDTTASSCSDVEVERKLQQAELRVSVWFCSTASGQYDHRMADKHDLSSRCRRHLRQAMPGVLEAMLNVSSIPFVGCVCRACVRRCRLELFSDGRPCRRLQTCCQRRCRLLMQQTSLPGITRSRCRSRTCCGRCCSAAAWSCRMQSAVSINPQEQSWWHSLLVHSWRGAAARACRMQ